MNQTATYRPRTGRPSVNLTIPPGPAELAAGRRSASIGWLPMRIWNLAPVAAPSVTRTAVIVTVLPMSSSRPVPEYKLPNRAVV